MHLNKLQQLFTAALLTACFTFAVPSVNAQHDLSKVTTYEALLDTFMAYPDSPAVRQQCLERLTYLNDSLKVPLKGKEPAVYTMISQGLHHSVTVGEAGSCIMHLKLHDFEDTLFLLLTPGSSSFFGILAVIGGRRTSEFFREILQRYTFDRYEFLTLCALRDMKDSAFYLIPMVEHYRDTIWQHYTDSCPPGPGTVRCDSLYHYSDYAKLAVLALYHWREESWKVAAEHAAPAPALAAPSPFAGQIPGSVYTPNGKLVTGALTAGGIYIKDRKIFVYKGAGR